MDDMISRHDSLAEENIEPNGRPATNHFEEWSSEIVDRTGSVYKDQEINVNPDIEQRIKEMEEVVREDLA